MEAAHAVTGVAGALVVLGVWSSVIRTLVVPRGLRSPLVAFAQKGTVGLFRMIARPFSSFERRDGILAWAAPLSILVTLVVWIIGFVLGYSLLVSAVSDESVGVDIQEGASALLALTFVGRAGPGSLTFVDLCAAATGPVVIGLLVGYLPTLYASYSRRETDVSMLEARAGEPNWGPEILARHASIVSLDSLDGFFRDWERWAADISESHTNYPVLVYVRSARPRRNWLVGIISVMDAAALHLALAPSTAGSSARMALRMGFVCLRDIAATQRIPYDPDPLPDDPIALTYDEFLVAVARLERAGYPIERTPEEAWPHFHGWRVNYEAIAYELADRIDAVPAPWTGARRRDGFTIEPRTPLNRLPGGGHGPIGLVSGVEFWGPALAAFVVILPAELPDKTFVATLVLATRFRPLAVWIGVTAAFAVQCAVAVTAGGLLALLPRTVVLLASAVLFAVGSVLMFRGGLLSDAEEHAVEAEEETEAEAAIEGEGASAVGWRGAMRPILTSFVVLFAAEWGDLSQLLTAGLAARYHAPLAVFAGSLTALALVAALAVLAGRWLQERVPLARIRLIAGSLLGLLALVSLVEAIRAW